jgi:hypothetical protein
MKTALILCCLLLFPLGSFAQTHSRDWIQTTDNEYKLFNQWGSVAMVEIEGENTAYLKAVDFSGGPQLKTVLTVSSKEAVDSLKKKIQSEKAWIPGSTSDSKNVAFIRWSYIHHIIVRTPPPRKGASPQSLALFSTSNRQEIQIGTTDNQAAINKVMQLIKQKDSETSSDFSE